MRKAGRLVTNLTRRSPQKSSLKYKSANSAEAASNDCDDYDTNLDVVASSQSILSAAKRSGRSRVPRWLSETEWTETSFERLLSNIFRANDVKRVESAPRIAANFRGREVICLGTLAMEFEIGEDDWGGLINYSLQENLQQQRRQKPQLQAHHDLILEPDDISPKHSTAHRASADNPSHGVPHYPAPPIERSSSFSPQQKEEDQTGSISTFAGNNQSASDFAKNSGVHRRALQKKQKRQQQQQQKQQQQQENQALFAGGVPPLDASSATKQQYEHEWSAYYNALAMQQQQQQTYSDYYHQQQQNQQEQQQQQQNQEERPRSTTPPQIRSNGISHDSAVNQLEIENNVADAMASAKIISDYMDSLSNSNNENNNSKEIKSPGPGGGGDGRKMKRERGSGRGTR